MKNRRVAKYYIREGLIKSLGSYLAKPPVGDNDPIWSSFKCHIRVFSANEFEYARQVADKVGGRLITVYRKAAKDGKGYHKITEPFIVNSKGELYRFELLSSVCDYSFGLQHGSALHATDDELARMGLKRR